MALTKVKTEYGIVAGEKREFNTAFKGIPFAKPPVGELRFMSPQKPDPWEGELLCTEFRDGNIQYRRKETMKGSALKLEGRNSKKESMILNPRKNQIPANFSEDCLYLNIWTPAESADANLPVMFWIFGGGFNAGYSYKDETDGDLINKQDVIFVTCGYRTGVMGFLTLPEFTESDPFHARGNLGLLDQLAALKWVNENIAAFGGDPDRITIHGQSAGGMSTKFHVVSPLSKGLFKRAVVQSGGGLNAGDPTRPYEELADITRETMRALGWTTDDLLTRPAQVVTNEIADTALDIVNNNELYIYQPCVDEIFLPDVPEILIKEGKINENLDIICGTVTGDSWMFSRKVRDKLTADEDALRAFAFSPQLSWGRYNARAGYPPIRGYFFEHKLPGDPRGVPHGSELAFLFGTLDRFDREWDEYDYKLQEQVNKYWTNFAKTGDPNGEGLPYWPYFTEETPYVLHFKQNDTLAEDIVENDRQNYVIEYTIDHPGMLENLDGFEMI